MDGKQKTTVKNMISIKFIGATLGTVLFLSCTPEPIGQIAIDNIAPASVTKPIVTNTAGGAIISYDLPDDEDLLYVKAIYSLVGGVVAETKASVYSNKLEIAGFGDSSERDVHLYAVDRSGNESTPLIVKVDPLTPTVFTVYESLKLIPDFGGVSFSWENNPGANISISLLMKQQGEYTSIEMLNTNRKEGSFSTRGLESEEGDFALYVRDRWDNVSDTLFVKLTPLFEMKINSTRIKPYKMLGDTSEDWGWVIDNLWDDNVNTGFHTEVTSKPWPHRFTFQMIDGPVKVSRFKVYQRNEDQYFYGHGNIRKFTLYGTNAPSIDGSYDGWNLMGEFESFKPSGLPIGEVSAEDKEYAANGEEFSVSPELPAYQYFRVKVTESWSGGNFMHTMEMPFWGSPEGYKPEVEE